MGGAQVESNGNVEGRAGCFIIREKAEEDRVRCNENKFNALHIRFLMQLTSEREEGSEKERETEIIKVSNIHCGQIYF